MKSPFHSADAACNRAIIAELRRSALEV